MVNRDDLLFSATRAAADEPGPVDPVGASPVPLTPMPGPAEDPSAAPRGGHGVRDALSEIERSLGEIRAKLDTTVRAHQHKEFSPARMVGATLQVLVVGFGGFALLDLLFQAEPLHILVKLAFAAVLQLGALTAFIVAPRE